jgi:hypothetical protein
MAANLLIFCSAICCGAPVALFLIVFIIVLIRRIIRMRKGEDPRGGTAIDK